MARTYLTNIDLNKNQILNVLLQSLATDPSTPGTGRIYFNTTDGVVKYYDGTQWISITAGDITSVTAGNGLTGGGTTGAVTLDLNTDGITLEISGDAVRIKAGGVSSNELGTNSVTTVKITDANVTTAKIADANVTTAKIADSNVTTAKIADGNITTIKVADDAITFAKMQDLVTMTVIGNLSGSTATPTGVTVVTDFTSVSNTTLATSQAIKTYADSLITGLGDFEGAFSASSSFFPVGTGGTKKGDFWRVSVAGTVQGVPLNVGDVLIAAVNSASTTVSTDWIFLESNRDVATSALIGVVRLATQAEVNAGTEASAVVTPATLATYLATVVNKYAVNIGNGSLTSITVTHNLGTRDVQIAVYDATSYAEVYPDIVATTTNTVTLGFTVAPTTNQYRVVVSK